jgi:hypothetical protein
VEDATAERCCRTYGTRPVRHARWCATLASSIRADAPRTTRRASDPARANPADRVEGGQANRAGLLPREGRCENAHRVADPDAERGRPVLSSGRLALGTANSSRTSEQGGKRALAERGTRTLMMASDRCAANEAPKSDPSTTGGGVVEPRRIPGRNGGSLAPRPPGSNGGVRCDPDLQPRNLVRALLFAAWGDDGDAADDPVAGPTRHRIHWRKT